MRRILLVTVILVFDSRVLAQYDAPVDSSGVSVFRRPRTAFSLAPLCLADATGGRGVRMAAEYPMIRAWNAISEATFYIPSSKPYSNVSGWRFRQDIVKYNLEKEFYTGFSLMYKSQRIDHTAIVPINDSVTYRQPYALVKRVISPSFVFGSVVYLGNDSGWFIGAAVYLGLRYKEATIEGLTPTEEATMWPFDVESTDFATKRALQDGIYFQPELNATFRIGYDFSR